MKLNYDQPPSNREIIVENKIVDNSLPSYIVELPSNGIFYESKKKEIKVAPFTIGQIRCLEATTKIVDISNKEREIANIVGRSILDFNVFDLTLPDFIFVLYWIRLNSFQNNPYTIQWTYKTEDDIEKKCISMVKTSSFEILECDKLLSPQFGWKTVRDNIELLSLNEEDRKYAEYAAILSGNSLEEKLAKLDQLPAERLFELKTHLAKFKHGVSEYVKVRDEEVESSPWFDLELRIEISDFFP